MKPFLFGRKPVETAPLRAPTAHHHPLRSEGIVRPAANGPSVETVKEGDKVVRLIVTCSCGERIEVDCLYPAGI
jgi:hypothetical protein